jgi:hypothetical protein
MRGQLTALGYIVEKIGESQRILPHAIRQKFTIRADGELEPFTEGSPRPVTVGRHQRRARGRRAV